MSWQLASALLIGLVLAGGAVWYERSRPSARLVALVAALAALAVAGRVALAPMPNLVATTDIVLLTGFSLGAAPGFAVGALAGLVSNIWLGQGPWTPWQMAGWGMVGLGGAGLARLIAGRASRLVLALAAGLAGLLYGALLDLSVMINFGGEQSLDRYLALSARGIPFNVVHALGNIAIIWVAGPAIIRMLSRYRRRSAFVWHERSPAPRRKAGAASLATLLAIAMFLPALALAGPSDDASSWLRAEQGRDGGWSTGSGGSSSPGMTAWVMLGLESAGINPRDLDRDPVEYLRKRAASVRSATDIERTILALEGAGVNSRRFGGRDLVAELLRSRRSDGSWKGGVNPTAFAVLALDAAGAAAEGRRSLRWLERAQNDDGGWGFDRGVGSDADSTGAALQALGIRAGFAGEMRDGAQFLRRAQRSDGGFPAKPGLLSNSQSTAWAIQGFVAAGVNPAGVRKRGASPIAYLERRQAADGHVAYSKTSDQTPAWVTAQALMGLEQKSLPLAAVPRSPDRGESGDGNNEDSKPASGGGGAAAPARGGGGSGGSGAAPLGAAAGGPSAAGKRKAKRAGKSANKNKQKRGKRKQARAKAESAGPANPREDRVVIAAGDAADIPRAPRQASVAAAFDDDGPPEILVVLAAFALVGAGAGALGRRSRRRAASPPSSP